MSKPRVLISTDIGGNDKDDAQSFVHALLYANEVNYRGFVSTRTDDGGTNGPAVLHEIISAYGRDYSNLKAASGGYPSPDALHSLVSMGGKSATWPGSITDGVQAIIDEARAASSSDPLYVLAWGPIHDVARALKAAPDIVDNVRVISIAGWGQDKAHTAAFEWLKDAVADNPAYSDLWWINSETSFRGMYIGPNGENNPALNLNWLKQNADGHGALGELLYHKFGTDLYGPGSIDGLKMGDTPSLLYLLDNISNGDPTANSWGGSFEKWGIGKNTWHDSDNGADRMGSYDGARTVYEHRRAFMAEFEELLDRARGATTPPVSQPTPGPNPNPNPNPTNGPEIDAGRNEAEDLDLSGGYRVESIRSASGGEVAKVSGSGTVSGTFDGTSGRYAIDVAFLNEDDGAAFWSLLVNGSVVDSWRGTGGSDATETHRVTVDLDDGDTIAIAGRQDGWEYARLDSLNLSLLSQAPSAPKPAPGLFTIDLGTTDADDLKLSGGYQDDVWKGDSVIKAVGTGLAAGVFSGNAGTHNIAVDYVNENDGAASWSLLVNGKSVANWTGTGGDGSVMTRNVAVYLEDGDTIAIQGVQQRWEFARVESLTVTKGASMGSGGTAPGSGPAAPSGAAAISLGLTEAEDFDLSGGYRKEAIAHASDGTVIKVAGSGSASGVFTGPDGDYTMDVRYLNENDGASTWSLFVEGELIDTWKGTGGSGSLQERRIDLDLDTGDEITLFGKQDGSEFARIDLVEIF